MRVLSSKPRFSEPEPMAVDFANTLACPACRSGDALASSAEARRWIRARTSTDGFGITQDDLARLRRFRGEVRQVLEAAVEERPPPRSAIASVNRHAARSARRTQLRWSRGRYSTVELTDGRPSHERLTALVAQAAVHLLSGTQALLLKRCEGVGCLHYLLARTPHQRWCSPTGCGNRARVQRHYQKLRSRSPQGRRRKTTDPAVHRANSCPTPQPAGTS